jgi:hypothetical protein
MSAGPAKVLASYAKDTVISGVQTLVAGDTINITVDTTGLTTAGAINIDDLIAQGHAPGRWVITSAAPGERLVPCFAACTSGAEVVGYAATRSQAKQVLGCEVAYRAEGYGPDGNEGWEPA